MKKEELNKKQLQLVSPDQAERLKWLGFHWDCDYSYDYTLGRSLTDKGFYSLNKKKHDNHYKEVPGVGMRYRNRCSASTVALALKWFRDEKNLTGMIARNATDWYFEICKAGCGTSVYFSPDSLRYEDGFEPYEAAESALLDELLTILEKDAL
ncbi:MAG: hypothetical protein LBS79_12035 [Tannerella sp.]|jgi:hypothetical protein|nr:hypothetical protein [Tannerella sp.]